MMKVGYHRVLQQVLQFAQSAVPITGILSLNGFLELAEVRLTVPRVTHELEEKTGKENQPKGDHMRIWGSLRAKLAEMLQAEP